MLRAVSWIRLRVAFDSRLSPRSARDTVFTEYPQAFAISFSVVRTRFICSIPVMRSDFCPLLPHAPIIAQSGRNANSKIACFRHSSQNNLKREKKILDFLLD